MHAEHELTKVEHPVPLVRHRLHCSALQLQPLQHGASGDTQVQHQWLSWLLRLLSSSLLYSRACCSSSSSSSNSKGIICALLVLLWLWLKIAGDHALSPVVPLLRSLLLPLLKAYNCEAEA